MNDQRWSNCTLAAAAICVGTLIPRLFLLAKYREALLESDEAIVGLMARHILTGEFPVFYWGQHYMGTLEAFITAGLFFLMGSSSLVLKLSPLLFFGAFVVAYYYLARRLTGRETSVLATALVGISPAFLTIWSLKSRGGYSALLLFGTLGLLLAVHILDRQEPAKGHYFLLGLVSGLAWWSHPLAAVYIVPIMIALLWRRGITIGLPNSALGLSGFAIGSAPFWIYNITHSWVSFESRLSKQTTIGEDLANFFGTGLPIILGARPNWSQTDLWPGAGVLVTALLLLGTALSFKKWRKARSSARFAQEGWLVIFLFVLLFPILFFSSGMAWFVAEPRYLIPLYSVIYILLLMGIPKKPLRFGVCVSFLALHLAGSFVIKHTEFVGYTNVESNSALIGFLRSKEIRQAFAPYWIAYRLTFESDEEIIASPPEADVVRYELYFQEVKSAEKPAYIHLNAPRYDGLHHEISPPDGYTVTRIGAYEVFTATQ